MPLALGALGALKVQKRGPSQPLGDSVKASATADPHLPTCLPRVASCMVAVEQGGLISHGGALGAGGLV